MVKGRSIEALAHEIERQEESKHDYVAPTGRVRVLTDDSPLDRLSMQVETVGTFPMRRTMSRQLGSWAGVPQKYFDRMQTEAPDLLATNLNHWLATSTDKRMVRTLDGDARAWLSDRYRPLDNALVAAAALPTLREDAKLTIQSAEVTERRMYIHAVTPRIEREVRRGDVVQAGILISNSEIGEGSVRVEPLLYRLACLNGLVTQTAMRKYHVGRRLGNGDEVRMDFFRSETMEADNRAFMMKMQDTVRHAFDEQAFEGEVARLQEAAQIALPAAKAPEIVQEVTKSFSLSLQDGENILTGLFESADLTGYGLVNAVTGVANGETDYDHGVELERAGAGVLELVLTGNLLAA